MGAPRGPPGAGPEGGRGPRGPSGVPPGGSPTIKSTSGGAPSSAISSGGMPAPPPFGGAGLRGPPGGPRGPGDQTEHSFLPPPPHQALPTGNLNNFSSSHLPPPPSFLPSQSFPPPSHQPASYNPPPQTTPTTKNDEEFDLSQLGNLDLNLGDEFGDDSFGMQTLNSGLNELDDLNTMLDL